MLKVVLWIGASLLLFIVLCIVGSRSYHEWESRHSLRRANGYYNGGDYRLAALSARRALDLKPDYADAARLMAKIAERSKDKAAIDWRRKVVLYDPTSSEAKLDLAACALQFKEVATAADALDSASEASKQSGPFIAMRARIAQARQDNAEAEKLWAKAAEVTPEDSSYRLNLALVRLAIGNSDLRTSALSMLEALRKDPKERAAATRALIADGISHRTDTAKILELGRELQSFPEAEFNDRLNYLDMLHQVGQENFTSYLTEVEEDSRDNPTNLAALITWMNKARLSSLAIDFANSLPPGKTQTWPVPLALRGVVLESRGVDDFAAVCDRRKLVTVRISAQSLPDSRLPGPEQGGISGARMGSRGKGGIFERATVVVISGNRCRLGLGQGNRQDPVGPDRAGGLQAGRASRTLQTLHPAGNAGGLYKVLTRLLELQPGDQTVQNNFAQVALLLTVDRDRARKIAFDLHQQQPANAAFAATYAFSLFGQGKLAQAVEVLDHLSSEETSDPSVALYYGIFLAAAGEAQKAQQFLLIGEKAPMFPEERELLKEAKRRALLQ